MTVPAASDLKYDGVRFFGARREYWRLLTPDAVLLVITLGIYRLWLNTGMRRFLWGDTEIAGETLEYKYIGTPLELLIGFLAEIAILLAIYAGFSLAAHNFGPRRQVSGLFGFGALSVLGQCAIYRAWHYHLTRNIYRGLRFHQEDSAWYYAPRGVAVAAFIEVVNWSALADALSQSCNGLMGRIKGGNLALGSVITFAILMGIATVSAAALLYPAFQVLRPRWWSGGLRFGALATMLARIAGTGKRGIGLSRDHPDTKARTAAIERIATVPLQRPFLDAAERAALWNICAR